MRAALAEDGQALVLSVFILALVMVAALAVAGLAVVFAARAAAQSAADAAALACATQARVTERVDARGWVYGVSVAVDPASGPAAAASSWRENLSRLALTTVSFEAVPSGPSCRVAARVAMRVGALAVLGAAREAPTWVAAAEARAYAPAGVAAGGLGQNTDLGGSEGGDGTGVAL